MSESETAVPTLRMALKAYPTTKALIEGRVASPRLRLDIAEVEPIHRAFAPMAQNQVYDISEMAVFTFLQAYAYGKPLVLLPVVLAARHQHICLIHNKDVHARLMPADLPGKRVGVRAYTQTTGAWVRNILMREHGLPLTSVDWITTEGAHLTEYRDPSFVRRAPDGSKLIDMLTNGEVDAAILGNDLPDDPRFAAVIPDAATAGPAWHAKTGLNPINHMLVVTQDLAARRPDLVREVFDLIAASKAMGATSGVDMRPIGEDAIRPSLELVLDLAAEQDLIPRRFTVDELFEPWRKIVR